jgi:hypothetical protein
MTDVSADAGTVSADSRRQQQNRDAQARTRALADQRTSNGLPSASDPETEADRTPRGSLLACMTANREPSNQGFEIDREATVCTASRRFLPFYHCPRRWGFSPRQTVHSSSAQWVRLRPTATSTLGEAAGEAALIGIECE